MRMQLDDACESAWHRAQAQWCYFWMCPKRIGHKVAGRCEGLTENRPWGLHAMERYRVCYVSFSLYSDYVCVITRPIFQAAVLGGGASVITGLSY